MFVDFHTHNTSIKNNHIKIINIDDFQQKSIEYSSLGIHPWKITQNNILDSLVFLERKLLENPMLLVGECGLDKAISTNFELQKQVFIEHIKLAEKYQRPLIIHCVRAYQEIFNLLKQEKFIGNVLFHGFNSSFNLALQLIKQGYYLSFGQSILTNTKLQNTFKELPLNFLALETDISLIPIEKIYTFAAQIKNISRQKLQLEMLQNYTKFIQNKK